MKKRLISVVVPAYNEAENIGHLYAEVGKVFANLPFEYELIFVNDGSTDGTEASLERIAVSDPRVKVLEFSRNFGQQAATSAGIIHAEGDAVIIMDADLQHPPHLIPEFLRLWEEGAEVVIGVRNARRDHSVVRRFASQVFFRLMNAVSEAETEVNASDFRLIDRKVADAFASLTEKRRLTRALIDWLGFRRVFLRFDVQDRASGETHYTYRKLFALAFSAVVAHSRVPLMVAGILGTGITLLAGALGLFIIIEQLILGDPLGLEVTPIGMLAVMLLFLNGIAIMFMGLLSSYVAAVREEAIGRPFYVLRKSVHFEHGQR